MAPADGRRVGVRNDLFGLPGWPCKPLDLSGAAIGLLLAVMQHLGAAVHLLAAPISVCGLTAVAFSRCLAPFRCTVEPFCRSHAAFCWIETPACPLWCIFLALGRGFGAGGCAFGRPVPRGAARSWPRVDRAPGVLPFQAEENAVARVPGRCAGLSQRPFGASRQAREQESARRVRGVAALFGVRGFLPAGLRRILVHLRRRSAGILISVRTQRRAGGCPAPPAARRPRRPGAHGGSGSSLGPLVLRTLGLGESRGRSSDYRARPRRDTRSGSS